MALTWALALLAGGGAFAGAAYFIDWLLQNVLTTFDGM